MPDQPAELLAADFENSGGAAQELRDYTGRSPLAMTYTADPLWNGSSAIDCNGLIVSGDMGDPVFASCQTPQLAADLMRASARGTALVANPGLDPTGPAASANHADAAATASSPPSYAGVQIEMGKAVDVAQDGQRFITASVDVVDAACGTGPNFSRLFFSLLTATGDELPLTRSPIIACPQNGGTGTVLFNAVIRGYPGDHFVYGGRFASDEALLLGGGSFRLRMRNDPGGGGNGGNGNDGAIDDLRVLDATPRIDARFVAPATAGDRRTGYRLTVTNDSDLGAKTGWSFTDTLPNGLTVAGGAVPAVQCAKGSTPSATSFAATASGSAISVRGGEGTLATGDTRCDVTVDVVAARPGTYSALNVTRRVGLDAGTGDKVTFPAPPAPSSPAPTPPAPTPPAPVPPSTTGAGLLLQCSGKPIVLSFVRQVGSAVRIEGVTRAANAGKRVAIRSVFSNAIVARPVVARDGTFTASVAVPSRKARLSTRGRYRAELGTARSADLRLIRRMDITKVTRAQSTVTITGNVRRPFADPVKPVEIRARTRCAGKETVVGTARLSPSGSFTARVPVPAGADAVIYRAVTKVPKTSRSRALSQTFTLPTGLTLA